MDRLKVLGAHLTQNPQECFINKVGGKNNAPVKVLITGAAGNIGYAYHLQLLMDLYMDLIKK